MVEGASRAAIEYGSHGLIIEVACDDAGAEKPRCDAAQAISPATLGRIVSFVDARMECRAMRKAHAV
jgi:3-deoxy-D-arabino-heptulosonate 7-phosphate (DAHP) synthase